MITFVGVAACWCWWVVRDLSDLSGLSSVSTGWQARSSVRDWAVLRTVFTWRAYLSASAARVWRAISMSSRAAMTSVRTAAPCAEMSQSGRAAALRN